MFDLYLQTEYNNGIVQVAERNRSSAHDDGYHYRNMIEAEKA